MAAAGLGPRRLVVFASFFFLPLALPIYYAAPARLRNVALVVCSIGFYGWWRPQSVGLMLASVLIDYVAAWMMVGCGLFEEIWLAPKL